jgi:transposase
VRLGKQKATVAVAHSILVVAYHLLTRPDVYADLGGDYSDRRDQEIIEHRLVRRLAALGNKVTLEKVS